MKTLNGYAKLTYTNSDGFTGLTAIVMLYTNKSVIDNVTEYFSGLTVGATITEAEAKQVDVSFLVGKQFQGE